MNPFEMVVLIVFIAVVGSVLRARYGITDQRGRRRNRHHHDDEQPLLENAETKALKDEVTRLKDRIQVLERIAVEKEDTLTRQIEELRDR